MAIVNKEFLVGTVMDFCPFGTVISDDTVGVDFKPTAESTDWLLFSSCVTQIVINPI